MNNLKDRDLGVIVHSYLVCALWSSSDGTDIPLDAIYDPSEATPETVKQAREDCERFLLLCDASGIFLTEWSDLSVGHDFWLTRNRHGAGFWDRGRGKVGKDATVIAQTFSEVNVVPLSDSQFIIE